MKTIPPPLVWLSVKSAPRKCRIWDKDLFCGVGASRSIIAITNFVSANWDIVVDELAKTSPNIGGLAVSVMEKTKPLLGNPLLVAQEFRTYGSLRQFFLR